MTATAKILLFLLLATIALVATATLLANVHSHGAFDHSVIFFDDDLSDSVVGWMIAIPVFLIAMIVTLVVLTGVGIVLASLLGIALLIALVATVFAVLMALMPIAVFLAVPVAIIWAIVKVARRSSATAPSL